MVVVTGDPDPAVLDALAVARRAGIDAALVWIGVRSAPGGAWGPVISVPDAGLRRWRQAASGSGRTIRRVAVSLAGTMMVTWSRLYDESVVIACCSSCAMLPAAASLLLRWRVPAA